MLKESSNKKQGIMQKTKFPLIGILGLALVLLLVASGDVFAGSPWKWIFSLKSGIEGKPMVMTSAVYVDQVRNRYYVADPGTSTLHSFDKSGKYLNSFNPGDQLLAPYDLVRDGEGIIWVVEKGRNSLTKIDLKNKKIEKNTLKNKSGSVIYPDRIYPADNGGFYVLDKSSGDVILFNSGLKPSTVFGCRDCARGFVDFVVKDNKIFALESGERAVYRFARDGSYLGKVELQGDFSFPFALEVGPTGLLYILDRHRGDIAVFNSSGKFKYRFLTKGHNRKKLYYPEDLLFDPWGRLCVVDAGNGRVEVFSR
jgi:streptogramin lyase